MLEPLEENLAAFIRANALFARPCHLLLAVSGGADSIALLYAMHMLALQGLVTTDLFCIHIDHQLRGDDSRADATFVAEHADRLGIPCDIRTIDAAAYAKDHRLSIETAGRQIRLASFAEAARSHGCNWVATGHQKNDNAETVLQRLRRGTGYRGLRGIQPIRPLDGDIRLARPLLSSTRDEIVAYLHRRGLAWREDRTNADCTYARNLVRHKLLPTLQRDACGSLIHELAALAASAGRLYDQIRHQAEDAAQRCVKSVDDGLTVDVGVLAALPQPVAVELIRTQLVRLGCGEKDLTDRHYDSVLQLARLEIRRGTVALPSGCTARRDHTRLVLVGAGPRACPPEPDQTELPIPGETAFAQHTIRAEIIECQVGTLFKIPADKTEFVEYLDLDRVGRPLIVRSRRAGDAFQPLGLPGIKKIGKFLTTARVPAPRRRDIILFEGGGTILWVCPVRIGEQARITERTRRVLKLSVT
jgi:tRNA(Ile)-lysidine synthase